MTDSPGHAPWLCHICDYTSQGEESVACSVCFKTTCRAHLKRVSVYNGESGLFEIRPICILCATPELSG